VARHAVDRCANAMTVPTPYPRRFYFNLRTLFVVVTMLGVLLGWLGVQLKWIQERRAALQWIVDYRARQMAAETGNIVAPERGVIVSNARTKAPWSLRMLGEGGVERLDVYQNWLKPDSPYSINELRSLFPEAEVKAVADRGEPAGGSDSDTDRHGDPSLLDEPLNQTSATK
jgi:hypothetical protein